MRTGVSLTELAQRIEGNKAAKKDFVADTRELRLNSNDNTLAINGHAEVSVNDNAHRQIGDRLGIPAKYYQRMQEEQPELLADNVNTWFQAKPERRMVRTLDNTARAFLSDRYQRIDHEEVAEMVLPVLADHAGLEVVSCEMTERRMYIKAVTPRIAGQVAVGDEVQAGVVISNSEIGLGALHVQPLILRLVCLNGMVLNDSSLKAHHVGGRITSDEAVQALLTDETLRADDKAILLKVRDVTRASLSQALLDRSIERFREAAGQKLEGNPAKAIEVLGKRLALNETEQGSVLRHLIEGGDLSRWGMANAITATAQEEALTYDRATELEALGGRVIDLAANDWRPIAVAA